MSHQEFFTAQEILTMRELPGVVTTLTDWRVQVGEGGAIGTGPTSESATID